MQLRGKKIWIVSTILVYVASFFMQSNFMFFQTLAQEKGKPRVNVVTILVDNSIYDSISGGVSSYANYVQSKLTDTKALIIPLDLTEISSYDIYRMMENIYFDGIKDVNSSLIGLIMIGNIPLPVVNQDGYVFPTVYPYVDFENQKYVWDADSKYFVPNGNDGGQAEIWHGLIDYDGDITAYMDFFEKVIKYNKDPDNFIGDDLWYEDFVAQKEGFLDENYQFYKNKIMFAEDMGYQRYHPLMKQLFSEEQVENGTDILASLSEAGVTISGADASSIAKAKDSVSEGWYTTKALEQQIKDGFSSDYTNLFSYNSLTTMRENIFAGGRWIEEYTDGSGQQQQRVKADTSSSMIQLKDTLYLGNDSLVGLIQDRNNIFESVVNQKIEDEKYSMNIVIPVSHEKITTKKVWFKKHRLLERWENYYFGKYALYIDDPKELSIYRGTYRNLEDLDGVTFDSLKNGYNPTVSSKDPTDTKLKSIGASYDIFSTQTEGNRGFTMMKIQSDLDTYDVKKQAAKWFKNGWRNFWGTLGVKLGGVKEMKWSTECDNKKNGDCETVAEFAQRRWGGASAMNLETGSFEQGRYALSGYIATNSWRSIYDMGGFQKLLQGNDEGNLGTGWIDGKGSGPQTAALSFKSYLKYSSPTKVNSWEKMGAGYIYYANKVSDEHEPVSREDYWNIDINGASFEKQSDSMFQVKRGDDTYVYKILSSVIKHDSTTDDEINGVDYEKYGESGTLGRYFADISKGYADVESSVNDVTLSSDQYSKNIVSYKDDLNTKKAQLQELINDTSKNMEDIKKLTAEINSLSDSSASLKNAYDDCVKQCKEGEECKCEDPSSKVSGNDGEAANKQGEIQNLDGEINSKLDAINAILEEISKISNSLKQDLIDMYANITALSPESVILTLNHVIYSEGGNPEEYEGTVSADLKRIQMLAEWKSVITDSKNNIETNYSKNVDLYKQAIKDVKDYQGIWSEIESMLSKIKEVKDGGSIEIKDGETNEILKDIFKLEGEVEDEEGNITKKTITLDENSLSKAEEINGEEGNPVFDEYFKQINLVFDNLVENDDKGDQVIALARSNKLFIAWLLSQQHEDEYDWDSFMKITKAYVNGDNRMSFTYTAILQQFGDPFADLSSADIISLFSQWAKGDGYGEITDPQQLELLEGVTEHMSGLNYLTPDRPIDSPRYVSMQSVAGNDINLIYPDLFKVEVFKVVDSTGEYDIHELMTGGEIRLSLEKYIRGKVTEYNSILEAEKKQATSYYNSKQGHFSKIQGIDALATPELGGTRTYNPFTYEDFVYAIGGEDMLDVIADVLYYQNLTNKTKHGYNDIEKDIEAIRESFTINYKREHVLEDYLVEDNTGYALMIPTYNKTGYEVAYVNSDAGDYVIPAQEVKEAEFAQQIDAIEVGEEPYDPTGPESDFNDECNIPGDGKLSLIELNPISSPWLEGFKCWLSHLTGSVKVTFSYDNSLGSFLSASGLEAYFKEPFVNYGESMSQYADDWAAMLGKTEKEDSSQEMVQNMVDAEMRNKEYEGLLSEIYRNVVVSNSNSELSEIAPSGFLEVSSISDLGNLTMSIVSTGDSCLAVNGTPVCGSAYTLNFNPAKNPFTGLVTSSDHIAGTSLLDVRFSQGGGDDYISKMVKFVVSPSSGQRFEIEMEPKYTVAGMTTPVKVTGWDGYDNKLKLTTDKYLFTVDKGEFVKDGAYVTGFTTNDFKHLDFSYRAPLDAANNSEAVIQIEKVSMDLNDTFSKQTTVMATHRQTLLQGSPRIKLNDEVILQGKEELEGAYSYKLQSDESIYDENSVLKVSKLQKIDIDILDDAGKTMSVSGQVVVTSKKGLVVAGEVKPRNGKTVFQKTSKFELSGGHLTLYYYPTTVAGEDVLSIDIQGMETRKVNLTIKPGNPYTMQAIAEDDNIQLEGYTNIEFIVSDIWGNRVDQSVLVDVIYDDESMKFSECPPFFIENGYKKLSVIGLQAGVRELDFIMDSGIGATVYLQVNKTIFPTEKLNVMYLNYFGDDWGNQRGYFSTHNKYVENMMTKSNKLITTTTQLVSEDNIKKMLWKLDPGFKIWNPDNTKTKMVIGNSQTILNSSSIDASVIQNMWWDDGDVSSNESDEEGNKGIVSKVDPDDELMALSIGDITTMYVPLYADWIQVDSKNSLAGILSSEDSTESHLYYIPNKSTYSMTNGVLFENGESVFDLKGGEGVFELSSSYINGYNVWNVIYKGTNYGSLVVYMPSYVPLMGDFSKPGDRYKVEFTFTDGSTANLNSIGVFDMNSNFELNSSYKSIQDSKDLNERIGFLGDFKNITLFAEGEIVGEATKAFGSEFVINLGDPVLSRKSENKPVYGTKFSGGIGREIYSDSENIIYGTYQIDYDNNGTKDLLVVYLDGTLKIAKNYGGNPDYRNMQELMRIAVGIEEVYVSDMDGNGYEDIAIRTKNNQLRVYLNTNGKFDVDGNVACLNTNVDVGGITDQPSNLSSVNQFFVEDMDQDKVGDIVTFDSKGYIKIFYGGNKGGKPNYLSTEKYACDTGWYEREKDNTEIVTALGLQISNDDIYDNSMVYRSGLVPKEIIVDEGDLLDYGIEFDPNDFDEDNLKQNGLIDATDNGKESSIVGATDTLMGGYNLDKGVNKYLEDAIKYTSVSLYENTLLGQNTKNYTFIPISYLNPDEGDLVKVWKNYTSPHGGVLSGGDKVTVTVTIQAYGKFRGSFGDIIQGPWTIYYDDNNIFQGIEFITKKGTPQVKQRDGNFAYLIDNITLNAGEKFQFKYELEYNPVPFKTMDITYDTFWSNDKYPDIKLSDNDGCNKDFYAYIGNGRYHPKTVVPLQSKIDAINATVDDNTPDNMDETNTISNDFSKVPGLVGDKIERKSLFEGYNWQESVQNLIMEGGINLNNFDLGNAEGIGLDMLDGVTSEINSMVDDITKGLCNGFEFGGSNTCNGLPVPFNQAFLAPGKYHLFGCIDLPLGKLEKGLPVLFFPGTAYVPAPIPMIDGLKSEADSFIWVPGGEYPSLIRVYVAPTLTAQVGIGVCIGPYATSNLFPSPLGDVAGNCVVFAVKPQCKKKQENLVDKESPIEQYDPITDAVKDSGICNQSQKGVQVTQKGHRSSPLNGYEYSAVIVPEEETGIEGLLKRGEERVNSISLDPDDYEFSVSNGGMNNSTEFSSSFFGIVNFETDASVGEAYGSTKNSIYIGNVAVKGGDYTVNKIRGGLQQGIREFVVDKWLDPQIRYIANQLTKMTVTVKLPNVLSLVNNEVAVLSNVTENFGSIFAEGGNDIAEAATDSRNGIVDGAKGQWNDTKIVAEGIKNKSSLKEIKADIQSVSSWTGLSYSNVTSLNKAIANPFESLASLMNESNLINITMNPITVKVPMILAEDINGYEIYLNQWIDANKEIIEEWEGAFEGFWAKCGQIEDTSERTQCYQQVQENFAYFVEFRDGEFKKMLDQVYANIKVLQEYRNFPFEIYDWIHVLDKYMAEISSLINNTLGYLSFWLETNSARFVGYVDAIVLIMDIIKTYQLIIDFSVSWSDSCGNCARDTYDQYSCKLSMLCDAIELPILQIPNFKIPNITLDLTDLNLGLDLILPKFNFQPVSIELPDLPVLPEPPSVSVNIKLLDLPNIPVLPSPPDLPEIPSFIPEVEIELPLLPPAPKIPRLPNSIEGSINIASYIGKIYCIVKGKFGLVGEKSVKAKIEQLTQRTYEVAWIDRIRDYTNWSASEVKNYGVDYEIATSVNLQFNFDPIYNWLDTLTTSINNYTTSKIDAIGDSLQYLPDKAQEGSDYLDNNFGNINLEGTILDLDRTDGNQGRIGSNKDETAMNTLDVEAGLTSDEIEYVSYEEAKGRLQDVLAYFKQQAINTSITDRLNNSITKIENQFNSPAVVNPNEEGIEEVKTEALAYVEQQKEEYNQLAMLINNDYDKFIAMVAEQNVSDTDTKSAGNSEQHLAFNTKLFNVDSSTKEALNLMKENNPYKDILENKQDIVNGYRNAINTNTASDLGLSNSQYLVLRTSIENTKNQVDGLYSVIKDAESTKLTSSNGEGISKKTLVASNGSMAKAKVTSIETDPAAYSQGIYEQIKNSKGEDKLVKVIYSDTFTEYIGNNYKKTDQTANHDLMLWDQKSIYLKESLSSSNGGGKGYYVSNVVKRIPYEETWLSFKGSDIELKIADADCEVKDWKVVGQTYDALTFSWTLAEENDVDGYLIKLVDKVDYSYEKADYTDNVVVAPKYVLAVPREVTMSGLYEDEVSLELLNGTKKIKDIYGTGKDLVQVVYYNPYEVDSQIVISDIPRKWYYARIATLNLSEGSYNINSPWSNQIVAGKQIVGDRQPPLGKPSLFRNSTSEIVSEGNDLEGFVGTTYEFRMSREDNVALQYVNISKDGKILKEEYVTGPTASLTIEGLFHSQKEKEKFNTLAIDQYGNQIQQLVTINYDIPEVVITDIAETEGGGSAVIRAELSQDIDQGDISFQRERGEIRKSMMPLNNDSHIFPLEPKMKVVEGEFSVGKGIALYDKDDTVIAIMDPDTGELQIQDDYVDSIETEVTVEKGAILSLSKNSENIFDITLPYQELLKLEANNYTVVNLPEEGDMGMYNGGKGVAQDGNIILYVSKNGNLYSEVGLKGTYEFDRELGANKFTLYQLSDMDKLNPIVVWLVVVPYETK